MAECPGRGQSSDQGLYLLPPHAGCDLEGALYRSRPPSPSVQGPGKQDLGARPICSDKSVDLERRRGSAEQALSVCVPSLSSPREPPALPIQPFTPGFCLTRRAKKLEPGVGDLDQGNFSGNYSLSLALFICALYLSTHNRIMGVSIVRIIQKCTEKCNSFTYLYFFSPPSNFPSSGLN